MKKYYFVIDDHNHDLGEVERLEFWAWYPSREACILAARYFNNETAPDYGLYIDWINEFDEDGTMTATIPFGDYETFNHTWPWPKDHSGETLLTARTVEYVWDEE